VKAHITAPGKPVNGTLSIGGSKSISNRVLVMDFLFSGVTKFENLSAGDDTELLQRAITSIRQKSKVIDIGHAGTSMRFLTALLSITAGEWVLTGSDRMKQRPITPLVDALRSTGANISYQEKDGFPPLKIVGTKLTGATLKIDGSVSSQFISAILMIAPLLENGLNVQVTGTGVSRGYSTLTVAMLKQWGASIECPDEHTYIIRPSKVTMPGTYTVESDWSSASYWFSVCALQRSARITLRSFSGKSLQPDSRVAEIYREFGVTSTFEDHSITIENTGTDGQAPLAFDLIGQPDLAQTIAVTAFGLGREISLTGLSTLQLKESRRISTLATELTACGGTVDHGDDYITIRKRGRVSGHHIKTYDDHRIAMSFAPLALCDKNIVIEGPDVVNKSYPEYWSHLQALGFTVHLQP
jgi:3-phosphoshikimate 1-carboxyvinyltransferase